MEEGIVISVIGRDRPGIVANVSRVLYSNNCNIEELTQTVIKGQFAMILIATPLIEEVSSELEQDLQNLAVDLDLDINLRIIKKTELTPYSTAATEPYVLTIKGEDKPGLVYGITEVLAEHGINITNLDAQTAQIGDKLEYIQFCEVDVPQTLDYRLIQEKLQRRGEEMGVIVDLQHKNIFQAINRI
ncbi:MAG: glycine cleavage system protein R [Thermodesulfobacteriota bacterium]